MSKQIPLTRGMVALVDDEDYEWAMQWNWHARPNNRGGFYAARTESGRKIFLHKDIASAAQHSQVDHVNHNTLDDSRKNLRIATNSQNQANRRKQPGTSSQYKGVAWDKTNKKWRVQIKFHGHYIHLGRFTSEKIAASAYNTKARELFGEFALLNEL